MRWNFETTEHGVGKYTSDKPVNMGGIGKTLLKCHSWDGSSVNGTKQPILYSFALDQLLGHKEKVKVYS